jgi:hypothetical protein
MDERRRDVWVGTTNAVELIDRATIFRLIDQGQIAITWIGPMTYVRFRDLYPHLDQKRSRAATGHTATKATMGRNANSNRAG